MKQYLILSFFLLSLAAGAQDTLIFNDGKEWTGNLVDSNYIPLEFQKIGFKDKLRLKKVYPEDVFSIKFTNGSERIYYEKDPDFPLSYSADDMRRFVQGRTDARYGYKTKWVMPVGFAACLLGAYALEGSIYSLLIPGIYVGLVQIPVVKVQPQSISRDSYIGDQIYKEGYNRSARGKRTKHAPSFQELSECWEV